MNPVLLRLAVDANENRSLNPPKNQLLVNSEIMKLTLIETGASIFKFIFNESNRGVKSSFPDTKTQIDEKNN